MPGSAGVSGVCGVTRDATLRHFYNYYYIVYVYSFFCILSVNSFDVRPVYIVVMMIGGDSVPIPTMEFEGD